MGEGSRRRADGLLLDRAGLVRLEDALLHAPPRVAHFAPHDNALRHLYDHDIRFSLPSLRMRLCIAISIYTRVQPIDSVPELFKSRH